VGLLEHVQLLHQLIVLDHIHNQTLGQLDFSYIPLLSIRPTKPEESFKTILYMILYLVQRI
jgi:hypothetical protein